MFGIFTRKKKEQTDLANGLQKTKEGLFSKFARLLTARSRIDDDMLDELEEILISSDVGVETTLKIVEMLKKRVAQNRYQNAAELQHYLREVVAELLEMRPQEQAENTPQRPYVILVVGVNGVGKTTTIGKLAYKFAQEGKKVLIGAADTFRAAAVDQLVIWAERAQCPIIKQQMGADPAAVAFDTMTSAKAGNYDVVLIDTAGRLHNKVNLMNELAKIKRVIQKVFPYAPQEVLLVLDATTGQNAYEQAKQFMSVTEITALALTKLDGTARGGVAIGICDQLQVPIKYIGVGEGIDHLQDFDREAFVASLFAD